MDQLNSTTQRQKGKHLSFKERVIIQTRLNDKHSPNKIAAELGLPILHAMRSNVALYTYITVKLLVTKQKLVKKLMRTTELIPAVAANILTSWNLLPMLRTASLSLVFPLMPA